MSRKIFVFGSNEAGRHGKGAALDARNQYGAQYGVGRGMTGWAYAIPTKDHNLNVRTLEQIKIDVDIFLQYARDRIGLREFLVTRIGCGHAGYTDIQIAPMFIGAPSNCELPLPWIEVHQRIARA